MGGSKGIGSADCGVTESGNAGGSGCTGYVCLGEGSAQGGRGNGQGGRGNAQGEGG